MGACHGSTKGLQVVVSCQVDHIDSTGNQGRTGDLHRGARVRSFTTDASGSRSLAQSSGLLVCDAGEPAENEAALQILENAMRMAAVVAQEDDIFDSQWQGVDGQNPLCSLLGTQNTADLGETILHLVASLEDLVASEQTVNHVNAPAKVYGDLHGQFRDMLLFLHNYGWPSKNGQRFIFNGNWVNSGSHQLEVVCLVYALKLAFPDTVWLNRGSHEDVSHNEHMHEESFEQACDQQLGPQLGRRVFLSFASSFEYLPIATVIGDSILVMHGGIGAGRWDITYLESIMRPIDHDAIASDKVIYNALRSGAIDDEQHDSLGTQNTTLDGRGHPAMSFSADHTIDFCDRNELKMIICGHEATRGEGGGGRGGYECMHDNTLMRVSSTRGYRNGVMQNDACILSLTVSGDKILVKPQVLTSIAKPASRGNMNGRNRSS